MLHYRTAPSPVEVAHEPVGPTVRGNLATTAAGYAEMTFSEIVRTVVGTSTATVIDMAVFNDTTAAHVKWISGGVFVTLCPTADVRYNQRKDSTTAGTRTSTVKGRLIKANTEVTVRVNEDLRYLDVISADGATAANLDHFCSQFPNFEITTADT